MAFKIEMSSRTFQYHNPCSPYACRIRGYSPHRRQNEDAWDKHKLVWLYAGERIKTPNTEQAMYVIREHRVASLGCQGLGVVTTVRRTRITYLFLSHRSPEETYHLDTPFITIGSNIYLYIRSPAPLQMMILNLLV